MCHHQDVDTTWHPADGTNVPHPTAPADIGRLIDVHRAAMYRVAVSIVGCPALAEDVVQDAVIDVWDGLPSYRAEAPIRNWVLRITHNAAVGTLRRLRDEAWDPSMLPDVAVSGQVERTAEARDELARLGDALAGLDDLSRSIVVLRELEGMSYADIADALEVSLGQVKIRLFRARRRLRHEVRASPSCPRRRA